MGKALQRLLPAVAVILTALVMLSCGGKEVVKEEAFDPEKSLAKAEKLIDDKEYEQARKVLLEVKNRDTTKKFSPVAQLRIADSFVREGEPEVGIQEYRRFLELYPDNQYASYAQYQIASAYFGQIESPDRGSGAAQRALREFIRLKELYPRNPYREVVELRIEKARSVIADGEFMTGEFYYKKGSYESAISRFEGLIDKFPEYKRMEETLFLLGSSYRAMKNDEKARDAFTRLVTRYPSSSFASQARKLMPGIGTQGSPR